jgi:hypothetical protein
MCLEDDQIKDEISGVLTTTGKHEKACDILVGKREMERPVLNCAACSQKYVTFTAVW